MHHLYNNFMYHFHIVRYNTIKINYQLNFGKYDIGCCHQSIFMHQFILPVYIQLKLSFYYHQVYTIFYLYHQCTYNSINHSNIIKFFHFYALVYISSVHTIKVIISISSSLYNILFISPVYIEFN